MQYPFADEFPESSRRALIAEEILAGRDLEDASRKSNSIEFRFLLINYILRQFIVFVREASKLAELGIWDVNRLEEEAVQFLRDRTASARYDRSYDRGRQRIRPMISQWGGILPEIQQVFQRSPEWQEYEDILLHVATMPPGPAPRKEGWESRALRKREPESIPTDPSAGQGDRAREGLTKEGGGPRAKGVSEEATASSATSSECSDFGSAHQRKQAIDAYVANWGCSEAALARAARVDPGDLCKWKNGLLSVKSDKKARIERALREKAAPALSAKDSRKKSG